MAIINKLLSVTSINIGFTLFIWFLFIFLYFILKKYDNIQNKAKKEVYKKNYYFALHLFGVITICLEYGSLLYDTKTIINIVNDSNIMMILSGIFLLIGFIIVIIGRLYLNNNWSEDIYKKRGFKLVTNSIYKYIRHPIYLGQIIMCFSTMFFLNNLLVIIPTILVLISNIYRAIEEEKYLDSVYKEEWKNYKENTWFMLFY